MTATRQENASSGLDRSEPIYVAGHRGLVGSAVWRNLTNHSFINLIGRGSDELDLLDRNAVFEFFAATKPTTVILAAARVGGILANSRFPADFLSENLRIQCNVLDAARQHEVPRLLFLGSSCVYPKFAPQPIKEEYLLSGHLEPTNDAYAIAKISGILQVQAVRRQDGLDWISAMPTNLYGPGDNFAENNSHVLPALIRRFEQARLDGEPSVTNWGTGTPRREFLHVDDLAEALLFLLEHYHEAEPINVGTGADVTISNVADLVARAVGYGGRIEWDSTKPDGTPRKVLDVTKLTNLGWSPRISLDDGVRSTVEWFRNNVGNIRQ
ncbi:GDP-L-fucose synthase [Skermania sp. ID1734]|uniref:GDP-L-fucose synthase family protein n=1 Tax=Skermania sp. ID1734 TaxID=2597516 RepID=UPI00117D77A7|nr:GDP-L-fucose synthase [Skermania sp. ID1734]TSD93185.1 GDP-L-fucose synthase [Skermania sp. ID1734]